jgi:hypothetical protein
MTPSLFRKLVKWFGIVALAHVAGMFLFDMMLSGYIMSLVKYEFYTEAYLTWSVFGIILYAVIFFIERKIEFSFNDFRRELRMAMKDENFSVIGYYKANFLKQNLWEIGIFAAFQLPAVLMCAVWPMVAMSVTFYFTDLGWILLTGIRMPLIGWIVGTVAAGAVRIGETLLCLILAKRNVEKD